jgi:hypothetical protein
MIRRRILILLLSLGTFGGFASGFHSLRHHSSCGASSSSCSWHHDAFERHVAQVCADAALHPENAPKADQP